MDIAKQISCWRAGADEELLAAKSLYRDRLYTQSLFHAHLALEKILKAHVCHSSALAQSQPPGRDSAIEIA